MAVCEEQPLDCPTALLCMGGEAVALRTRVDEEAVLRRIVNIEVGIGRNHIADGDTFDHMDAPVFVGKSNWRM